MTKMAGRGKGKASMSFSMEQLGFSKGEMLPAPVLQPSSTYPILDHKPLPIQMTTEMSYLVELKRDFTEYMRESSNNVQAVVLNEDIERYCEDYEETITRYNRLEYESKYDWSRMPMELKSSRKRKIQRQDVKPNKKRKIMETSNIENKLTELEKEESTQRLNTEEEVEEEEEGEDKNKEEERVKDEEEIDEEMDDGTDYANDYFDTGENYYSEDDNDDGPVF
ncbi:DNA-directed RNA polymerase III subunit RPC7-like [Polyergus mexicanus]|uniref:DNA-directed RNA polymerase III subunit RPC7-like n=1 Tax=Polyergus mexicanus TaxID=615972 RepID=UPI0038B68110